MNIEEKLGEKIENAISDVDRLEVGSEEYTKGADGIAKLVGILTEKERLENEKAEKALELEENRKDRWIKNGITVAGIVIPTVVTIWGTVKSFEFEKEGTITTIMGRGFINKLLPKK